MFYLSYKNPQISSKAKVELGQGKILLDLFTQALHSSNRTIHESVTFCYYFSRSRDDDDDVNELL